METYAFSPTAALLRQADLGPDAEDGDKDIDVDLYQAALLILAHLDRLAAPYVLHGTLKVFLFNENVLFITFQIVSLSSACSN